MSLAGGCFSALCASFFGASSLAAAGSGIIEDSPPGLSACSDCISISLSCSASGSTKGPLRSRPMRSASSARARSRSSFARSSAASLRSAAAAGSSAAFGAAFLIGTSSSSSSSSPSTSSMTTDDFLPEAERPAIALGSLAAFSAFSRSSFSTSSRAHRRCSAASLLCGSRCSTMSRSLSAWADCDRRRCAMPRRRYAFVYESSIWMDAVQSARH